MVADDFSSAPDFPVLMLLPALRLGDPAMDWSVGASDVDSMSEAASPGCKYLVTTFEESGRRHS